VLSRCIQRSASDWSRQAAAQFASDHGHSPSRAMQTAIKLLGVPAALAGMAMSTYTGALLSATSTPLWAAAPRRIAALFGASAMASGAATLTIAEQGHGALDTARPLDRITLVASALELFAAAALSRTRGGRRIERDRMGPRLRLWCDGARRRARRCCIILNALSDPSVRRGAR
jgi:hypothetical protein